MSPSQATRRRISMTANVTSSLVKAPSSRHNHSHHPSVEDPFGTDPIHSGEHVDAFHDSGFNSSFGSSQFDLSGLVQEDCFPNDDDDNEEDERETSFSSSYSFTHNNDEDDCFRVVSVNKEIDLSPRRNVTSSNAPRRTSAVTSANTGRKQSTTTTTVAKRATTTSSNSKSKSSSSVTSSPSKRHSSKTCSSRRQADADHNDYKSHKSGSSQSRRDSGKKSSSSRSKSKSSKSSQSSSETAETNESSSSSSSSSASFPTKEESTPNHSKKKSSQSSSSGGLEIHFSKVSAKHQHASKQASLPGEAAAEEKSLVSCDTTGRRRTTTTRRRFPQLASHSEAAAQRVDHEDGTGSVCGSVASSSVLSAASPTKVALRKSLKPNELTKSYEPAPNLTPEYISSLDHAPNKTVHRVTTRRSVRSASFKPASSSITSH